MEERTVLTKSQLMIPVAILMLDILPIVFNILPLEHGSSEYELRIKGM